MVPALPSHQTFLLNRDSPCVISQFGETTYGYMTSPFSFSFIFTGEGMDLSGDMGGAEGGNSLLLWAGTKMMWPQAPIHVPARTGKIWSPQPFQEFRFVDFSCGVPDSSISTRRLLRGPVQNYRMCRIDLCAPFISFSESLSLLLLLPLSPRYTASSAALRNVFSSAHKAPTESIHTNELIWAPLSKGLI